MHEDIRKAVASLALVGVGFVAIACDITGGGGRGNVSVTLATSGASSQAGQDITVTGGGHTLVLQSATITFKEIELEREGADDDGDSETQGAEAEHEEETVLATPLSVSLNLDESMQTIVSVPVPAGSYDELEAEVSTIRLRGTYDGQSFDVTLPVDADIEAEFDQAITVSDGEQLNLTVALNPGTWFTRTDGSLISPSELATSATLRAEVLSRIEADFDAIEDDDRDGNPDD